MKAFGWAAALAVLLMGAGAQAQEPLGQAPGEPEPRAPVSFTAACAPGAPPDGFTETEQLAWTAFCAGEPIRFWDRGESACLVEEQSEIDPLKTLSQRFFSAVSRAAARDKGLTRLEILCAHAPDGVTLEGELPHLAVRLTELSATYFETEPGTVLADLEIENWLTNTVHLDYLTVRGALRLRFDEEAFIDGFGTIEPYRPRVFMRGAKAQLISLSGAFLRVNAYAAEADRISVVADIRERLDLDFARVDDVTLRATRASVFDVSEATVSNVWVDESAFDRIDLRRAEIVKDLQFRDVRIAGDFSAYRATVGGSVFFTAPTQIDGQLNLYQSKVGGDVALERAVLLGDLEMARAQIQGAFRCRDAFLVDRVDLEQASLSAIDCDRVAIAGRLDIDRIAQPQVLRFQDAFLADVSAFAIDVTGGVFFRRSHVLGDVQLRGSRMRALEFDAAEIDGTLSVDQLEVSENLFLRDGFVGRGVVHMRRSSIGGSVDLSGGAFHNRVDFVGAEIRALHFASLRSEVGVQDVQFMRGASLKAPDARLGLLSASERSFLVVDGDARTDAWVPMDWRTAQITRLQSGDLASSEGGVGSFGGAASDVILRLTVPSAIDDQTGEVTPGRFNPGVYQQLAAALDAEGRAEAAREVRYARWEAARTSGELPPYREGLLFVSKWVAGYGEYPERTLAYAVGIVILSFLLTFASVGARGWPLDTRIWYAVDCAVPVFHISTQYRDVNHGRWLVNSLFVLLRFAGLIVAVILAASIGAL